ncbi:MAG TPA: serine protease [Candidatus Eisenbacteria bacterium]|nr:serine protease [Candidatus Eisenbacteria bacterium]
MRLRPFVPTALALAAALCAPFALAADPTPVEQTVAYVICDSRQGSGSLTTLAGGGYVLTVGHVPLNPDTGVPADQCHVGFVADGRLTPDVFYEATIVHAIFDRKTDRDMAILKVGKKVTGQPVPLPASPLKTNEFALVGDPVTVYGYPGGLQTMRNAAGKVLDYKRGSVVTDAQISQGYSGGPAVDAGGRLVGLAERVTFETDDAGNQVVIDYELTDILPVIAWLDSFGLDEHDKYLVHGDPARYDGAPYVIRDEKPGCGHVVRTTESPTLYCLLAGPARLVFPNEKTFFSWFPDYAGVELIRKESLPDYPLIGNMTMKAGSLVKIVTDPKVYLVSDSIGTLRWVPSEQRAIDLFGPDWAAKVNDVPDVFFIDYRIGPPIE